MARIVNCDCGRDEEREVEQRWSRQSEFYKHQSFKLIPCSAAGNMRPHLRQAEPVKGWRQGQSQINAWLVETRTPAISPVASVFCFFVFLICLTLKQKDNVLHNLVFGPKFETLHN